MEADSRTPNVARRRAMWLVLISLSLAVGTACGQADGIDTTTPTVAATAGPRAETASPTPAGAVPATAGATPAVTPRAAPAPTPAPALDPAPLPALTPTAGTTATAVIPPPPQPTASPAQPLPLQAVRLLPSLTGLSQPLFLTHGGDGSGNVFIVQRGGQIRVASGGMVRPEPLLDLTQLVGSEGSEQGLLGLAFHPNFRNNRWFYVNYTDRRGNTVIARYTAAPGRVTADPATAKPVLAFAQPYRNHNGGMLAFGPDGKLWIGTGDGGSAGDPHGNGQNKAQLLGKMLRIDVDSGDPYSIPSDNPYVGDAAARPEVWAIGLRNPWRYGFDRATGDLWIADVGQNAWEEIDFVPTGSRGGLNFGWNRMEGAHCFPAARQGCDESGLVLPVAEYSRSDGCSVTGGYVYRGQGQRAMQGRYFFSDFCSGRVWGIERTSDGAWRRSQLATAGAGIASFGEDEAGELYAVNLNNGTIYQLTAE